MIKLDVGSPRDQLENLGKQAPFALALALTRTGQDTQESMRGHFKGELDRPTSFTLRSIRFKPATKRLLESNIWLTDEAPKGVAPSRYLKGVMEGGYRRSKSHEKLLRDKGLLPPNWFTVPGKDAPLNKFGNLTGGRYTSILSQLSASRDQAQDINKGKRRQRYFVMKRGKARFGEADFRPLGVYERKGKKQVKSILHFVKGAPTYKPMIDMDAVTRKVIDRRFDKHLREAIDRALATAR